MIVSVLKTLQYLTLQIRVDILKEVGLELVYLKLDRFFYKSKIK